jgi:hypothetical protein
MTTIRRYLSVMGFLTAALLAPAAARATGESCVNDIDCKTGPTCGGEICDWTIGMKCGPATAAKSGQEGWCTVSTDCKCASEGATCDSSSSQCTKTTTAAGGSGGASGSAGSSSATGGSPSTAAGGSPAGGSPSTATGGSPSTATGGTSSTTTAGATSTSSSSSSGCSLAGGVSHGSLGFALGAMCAISLIVARRRRRAA